MRSEFDVSSSSVNALHGASSVEQAEKELAKFFPMEQTVAVLKPGLTPEKKSFYKLKYFSIFFIFYLLNFHFLEEIENKIKESGFLIATKKSEKLTEDLAKEMYKDYSEQPHFNDLVGLMTRYQVENKI